MPSKDFLALNPGYQPPRMPPRELEHVEQVAFIRWCEEHAGEHPALGWVYAIPNGGKRSLGTAVKLKAEGVKAGYPDLGLDVARAPYHGWRCELKVKGGRVRKNQNVWRAWLISQQYRVDICWSWREAALALCVYLGIDPLTVGLP